MFYYYEEEWILKSEMQKIEKRIVVKCVIATLCVVLIFTLSIAQSKYMEQKINETSQSYLSVFSLQSASIINHQINEKFKDLDVLSHTIEKLELRSEEIAKIITEQKNQDFLEYNIILKNGDLVMPEKTILNEEVRASILSANNSYIRNLFSGEAFAAADNSRKMGKDTIFVYGVPIYKNDNVEGVLVAYYSGSFFRNLAWPKNLDDQNHTLLADANGNPVFVPGKLSGSKEYDNALARIAEGWNLEGQAGEQLKKDILGGKDGVLRYTSGSEDLYVSYHPLGINQWFLITLIPAQTVKVQFHAIYGDLIPSLIYLVIILGTMGMYFSYIRSQNVKRLEYRLKQQSVNDESYRMIMEQSNDIIFEYDTVAKTYYHTSNFKKTFGYEPRKRGFLGFLERDYIHPDDLLRLVEMYESMKEQKHLCETEVRIVRADGEYIWVHIYLTGIFDNDSRLVRVIGKIEDINDKKMEMERFKELAVMDSATGVYNKQTTEDMINLYLKGEGRNGTHAIFIIDIDDFKLINDDHGHRQGDFIISEMGTAINRIFRSTDIKGRIGGDEFMVLVKDIESLDFITNKAKAVCEIFKDKDIGGDKQISVSASIGIAIYDKDGTTYEELYEAADRALYTCKNVRKGTFSFCGPKELMKVSSR
jgi:diguanylate cyclase (GGDEF)-like protein/PAS domain S-box-containing protein